MRAFDFCRSLSPQQEYNQVVFTFRNTSKAAHAFTLDVCLSFCAETSLRCPGGLRRQMWRRKDWTQSLSHGSWCAVGVGLMLIDASLFQPLC